MSSTLFTRATANDDHAEIFREAVTMVLYVSVVEIAELAALPESHFADGTVTGAVGGQLLAIVWGTAVGLALAHWFAFRLAAPAFRGERPTRHDTYIGLAGRRRHVRRRRLKSAGAGLFRRARPRDHRRRARSPDRHRRLPHRPLHRKVTCRVRLL